MNGLRRPMMMARLTETGSSLARCAAAAADADTERSPFT